MFLGMKKIVITLHLYGEPYSYFYHKLAVPHNVAREKLELHVDLTSPTISPTLPVLSRFDFFPR